MSESTMTAPVVRLSFPAKADYLLLARLALSGVGRNLPLGDEELADLKLAVTEACGNAVRHAYPAGDGPVDLALVLGSDKLVIIVEDQGTGGALPQADAALPESLESGMGMSIIRAVVDEVEVEPGSDGRGTVVRMTKYLATKPA
jgi:serine/threonine-protein kinase RsbW